MNEITKILVFDFDETLFRMPGYTDRFSVERLYPELSFPNPYSFYDHPTSMDPEIHNIQIIGPVYEDWKAASNDPNTRTILITHRTEELRPCAERLLNMHGIKFDEMYFLGRMTQKIDTLASELEELPEVREISVYEDSLEQLRKYQDFLQDQVKMYFVDKSKVIRLHNFNAGESRRIELQ